MTVIRYKLRRLIYLPKAGVKRDRPELRNILLHICNNVEDHLTQ